MYISESNLITVLEHPFYTNTITENLSSYSLYRDRYNVSVYTIRYNLLPDFSKDDMIHEIINKVKKQFPKDQQVIGMIDYDLLLIADDTDPKSYYIWRANSNHRLNLDTNETIVTLNHHSLFNFIRDSALVNVPTLNANYRHSKVSIERVLAIVFTFVPV